MKCDYGKCENEATTEGFVLVRRRIPGHVSVDVNACDKHKKKPGFFEKTKKEGEK